MRLHLWKQLILSLLFPILIASAFVIYAVYSLNNISYKVTFLEISDDINLALLELRRYEKNILLFKEEENIKKFYSYQSQLDSSVRNIEREILTRMSKQQYRSLIEEIESYKKSAHSLISTVKKEQKLLEDIRPLGRLIEKNALNRQMALELRRHEKNYIIYGEAQAIEKLHRTAAELVKGQPQVAPLARNYLDAFDSLIEIKSLKEGSVEKMRLSGKAIETKTMELSNKARHSIDRTISLSRKLFIGVLLFLIVSTSAVACLFSTNVARLIKTVETSFGKLNKGDFTNGINIDTGSAPEEVISLVKTYNQTVDNLRESRTELENTLKKLEDANRELIDHQDELVEARKLTAMRLLASEIAHEINNPLSSIRTFLGMFYEDMRSDDIKKEALTVMLNEVNRCHAVLKELADFARKEPLKLKEANPAKLIDEAIDAVSKQNEEKLITVKASIERLPAKAVIDPVLIYQAMVNLIANAYNFTPPGGIICIEGDMKDNTMSITVRDNGEGIPGENLPYIFEPFFSTRKSSGGSGLGLAITKKIIERHGGSIQVESRPGEETAFKIALPVNREEKWQRPS